MKNFEVNVELGDKKLIIFDFDGTLIDSAPDLANSINFMLQTLYNKHFEAKDIYKWIGNGAQTLVQRALEAAGEDLNEIPRALEVFLHHYQVHLCDETILFDGVKEVLSKLKSNGYKIALVTNKPQKLIEPILNKFDLQEYFALILGAESCKEKKPSPEPLLCCLKEFGLQPSEAVMIGDSKNDLLAAKRAGIDAVGVSYGYDQGEVLSSFDPICIISQVRELLPLFGLKVKVGVIGGGVAGSSTAIYLKHLGCDVTLFEKKDSLIDGPPMCHLHAGGNLYREISDAQCVQLLKESIELIRFYPNGIDFRPTIVTVPITDPDDPSSLLPRLKLLQDQYQKLIDQDSKNKVLGEPQQYYKLFSYEELEVLQQKQPVDDPQTFQQWMIPFAKEVDLNKLKYPVVIVQEFGLNLFRIAASATLLAKETHLTCKLRTTVCKIEKKADGFFVYYLENGTQRGEFFDYLVNAAGFASGIIDDMLGYYQKRFVEFKAAYVTHWNTPYKWAEVIFHGERGTPQGMGQFTPYPGNFFQLHAMTKTITLFDDGLSYTDATSAYPNISKKFIKMIEEGWNQEDVQERTQKAIKHLSRFIPSFRSAQVMPKPLYGAQQIPGEDATLRAAEGSFEGMRYARSEIVKASSVLTMADAIVKRLIALGYLRESLYRWRDFSHQLDDEEVNDIAKMFALKRGYPQEMALRNKAL